MKQIHSVFAIEMPLSVGLIPLEWLKKAHAARKPNGAVEGESGLAVRDL
jgi:hypothetical protein